MKCGFGIGYGISYGIGQKDQPIWVSVSVMDQNQNSDFGRTLEKGRKPSQAKLKITQLELWLEQARLGLITKFLPTYTCLVG